MIQAVKGKADTEERGNRKSIVITQISYKVI